MERFYKILVIAVLFSAISDCSVSAHEKDSSLALPEISVVAQIKTEKQSQERAVVIICNEFCGGRKTRSPDPARPFALYSEPLYAGIRFQNDLFHIYKGTGKQNGQCRCRNLCRQNACLEQERFRYGFMGHNQDRTVARSPEHALRQEYDRGDNKRLYPLSHAISGSKGKTRLFKRNTYNAKASVYRKFNEKAGLSVGLNYYNSDGYFKNTYDGSDCDWIEGGSARARVRFQAEFEMDRGQCLLGIESKAGRICLFAL